MNLRVPWNARNFLTSCKPVSFSRRTLHHGVSKCWLNTHTYLHTQRGWHISEVHGTACVTTNIEFMYAMTWIRSTCCEKKLDLLRKVVNDVITWLKLRDLHFCIVQESKWLADREWRQVSEECWPKYGNADDWDGHWRINLCRCELNLRFCCVVDRAS